jgi:RNA polymerase sigma-70 factor (ECF subfamily)
MPEHDTVWAAAAGDRGALTAFVRDTYDDVWRFCASLGSGQDTSDLVQETYERALRSLHRFEGRSTPRSWLLTIARNVCADAVRRARRRRAVEGEWLWRDRTQADHAGSLELELLLDALPRERREAFVLTQIVGLSYREAAEVCQVPIGTIRSRVARARDDLTLEIGTATG